MKAAILPGVSESPVDFDPQRRFGMAMDFGLPEDSGSMKSPREQKIHGILKKTFTLEISGILNALTGDENLHSGRDLSGPCGLQVPFLSRFNLEFDTCGDLA